MLAHRHLQAVWSENLPLVGKLRLRECVWRRGLTAGSRRVRKWAADVVLRILWKADFTPYSKLFTDHAGSKCYKKAGYCINKMYH